MSSTSNIQALLPYIFRPVYTWSSNDGSFSTTINLSNIDRFSANTVSYGVLYVGDSNSNVYIGSNSGNLISITTCNAISNTAIGVLAASGLSNSCNSDFIGAQCALGGLRLNSSIIAGVLAAYQGRDMSNAVLIGTATGYKGSNISNSVLIGCSNSSNISNISNTISIGGNAGGGGNSNIYIGTSCGNGVTGSCNLLVGNGISIASTTSNALLIGSGSNVLLAGSFSNGVVSIGSTNTTTNALDPQTGLIGSSIPINSPTWGGDATNPATSGYGYISLDVTGWQRINSGGLAIGTNPYDPRIGGKYELDVSGHFRVSDGNSSLSFSNYLGGGTSSNVALNFSNTVPGGTAQVNIGYGGTGSLNVYGGAITAPTVTASNITAVSNVSATGVAATGFSTLKGCNVYTAVGTGTYQVPGIHVTSGVLIGTVLDTTHGYYNTGYYTILNSNIFKNVEYGLNLSTFYFTVDTSGNINITVGNGTSIVKYNFTLYPVD